MNPLLGIFLHAVGGYAAGSFYIPFKKVKNWAWESYWLISGFFAWLIAPWIVAFITVPDLMTVIVNAPHKSMVWCYLYGVLWGIGGLTFGLTMRYLGMSLGYALALGLTAAFGTVVPPLYFGTFGAMVASVSGTVTLGGVVICLAGIAVCGWAGILKELELTDEQKRSVISEFNFKKGFWVAILCGVMSACFAFGIAAGKPIADYAVSLGTTRLWMNSAVFLFILSGGITTNLLWCVSLNIKNRTGVNYIRSKNASLASNYFFSALAGTIWYFLVYVLRHGDYKDGEIRFFKLDYSYGVHNRVQQYLGACVP